MPAVRQRRFVRDAEHPAATAPIEACRASGGPERACLWSSSRNRCLASGPICVAASVGSPTRTAFMPSTNACSSAAVSAYAAARVRWQPPPWDRCGHRLPATGGAAWRHWSDETGCTTTLTLPLTDCVATGHGVSRIAFASRCTLYVAGYNTSTNWSCTLSRTTNRLAPTQLCPPFSTRPAAARALARARRHRAWRAQRTCQQR